MHSEVLQNVGDRLGKAMKAFFRRVKAKKKAGFPRFRERRKQRKNVPGMAKYVLRYTER